MSFEADHRRRMEESVALAAELLPTRSDELREDCAATKRRGDPR